MRKATTKLHLAELAEFRSRIKQALAGEGTAKEAETLAGLAKLLPLYLKIVELERELTETGKRRNAQEVTREGRRSKDGQTLSEGEWTLLEEIIQSRNGITNPNA